MAFAQNNGNTGWHLNLEGKLCEATTVHLSHPES